MFVGGGDGGLVGGGNAHIRNGFLYTAIEKVKTSLSYSDVCADSVDMLTLLDWIKIIHCKVAYMNSVGVLVFCFFTRPHMCLLFSSETVSFMDEHFKIYHKY